MARGLADPALPRPGAPPLLGLCHSRNPSFGGGLRVIHASRSIGLCRHISGHHATEFLEAGTTIARPFHDHHPFTL